MRGAHGSTLILVCMALTFLHVHEEVMGQVIHTSHQCIDTSFLASFSMSRSNRFTAAQQQFYAKTLPQMDGTVRKHLQEACGVILGSYVPDDSYIFVGEEASAACVESHSAVSWVGRRSDQHKLDSVLLQLTVSPNSITGNRNAILPLYIVLVEPAARGKRDAAALAREYSRILATKLKFSAVVRVSSERKLVLDVHPTDALKAARTLAFQAAVEWIEPKSAMRTRNFASSKILTTGISEESRRREQVRTKELGLNGTGQVVGVADTGLDFDNCFLYQDSFPFPCFRADLGDPEDIARCPPSAFASMLALPDLAYFVSMMTANASEPDAPTPPPGLIDMPLLESGSTVGASVRLPSLVEQVGLPRPMRERLGHRFAFAEPFRLLLDAWRGIRPSLLTVLRDSSLCLGCGGVLTTSDGGQQFEPIEAYRYDNADTTDSRLLEVAGAEQLARLRGLLFECCACFFATYVDPAQLLVLSEEWKGPVPPIRQLIDLAGSSYALTSRKVQGLTAIEPSILTTLCNISRGGGDWPVPSPERNSLGVREGMCRDIDIGALGISFVVNTCSLTWEPRLMESTMARCVEAQLLRGPSEQMDPLSDEYREAEFTATTTREYVHQHVWLAYHLGSVEIMRCRLRWWEEYTRVPPMERVDVSRRKVVGYYTMPDCNDCGACGHVRVDTRQFLGTSTSQLVPNDLEAGAIMSLRVSPSVQDWRLDSFEARYTQMSMDLNVRVRVRGNANVAKTLSAFRICVVPQALEAEVMQPDESQGRWNITCLNSQPDSDQETAGQEEDRSFRPTQDGEQNTFERDLVVVLPHSADGWLVALANAGSEAVSARAYAQLWVATGVCSDKRDGELLVTEPTHSTRLNDGNLGHISSSQQCERNGQSYCDGTADSGRQLDLCGVCGGTCFAPSCFRQQCPENNLQAVRMRFLGEFHGGTIVKEFPGRPSCSGVGELTPCELYNCNFLGDCEGSRERYLPDTRFLVLDAGQIHTFPSGALVIDSAVDSRIWALHITVIRNPTRVLRAGGSSGWQNRREVVERGGGLVKRVALSLSSNVTVVTETPHELVMSGTVNGLMEAVAGLTFTPDNDLGTTLDDRQVLLRFDLRLLDEQGRVLQGGNRAGIEGAQCSVDGVCICISPGIYEGEKCDFIKNRLDVLVTIRPSQSGKRIVPPPPTPSSRRPAISRGGHGTHTAATAVGAAYESIGGRDIAGISQFDALASGAKLWFMDIGQSGSAYLTPPESKGDALLGRAYREGDVRVFLAPWSCYDFVWWDPKGNAYTAEGLLVEDGTPLDPTICNRYTTDAWEMDEFVWSHPDMLVVVPSGDNGRHGANSIASPGTCKNCLVVGASESWPSDLVDSAKYLISQCRPEDCPQDVDPSEPCGGASTTSHLDTPACCLDKYDASDPSRVAVDSGRGFAVSEQGEGERIYVEQDGVRFGRIKPDVVAPGVNIVSARSDGNTQSGGTHGCRCCAENAGSDASSLAAMSGTSMAASAVSGMATLVREYFAAGFYPSGVRDAHNPWQASAALVKAVIVCAGEDMRLLALANKRDEDISALPMPNLHAGFGRPNLLRALRLRNASEVGQDEGDSGVRIFVKDHSVAAALGPDWYVRNEDVSERVTPRGFSIAAGEEMAYSLVIFSATPDRPLVATLTWMDPPVALGSSDVIVNNLDLVVTVTPLLGELTGEMLLADALALPVNAEAASERWGNQVQGGDTENNVEKIMIQDSSKAVITVRVIAKRIASNYPCQPFALVVSGQLAGNALDIPPWETQNFRPGVCGREPAPQTDDGGLDIPIVTVVLSVFGTVLGCALVAVLYHRWHVNKDEQASDAENRLMSAGVGYLPTVKDTSDAHGKVRKAETEYVVLDEEMSHVDNFYIGKWMEIMSGAKAGQRALVTAYEGRTRTAVCEFLNPPQEGDTICIRGGGYQVGSAGYMETTWAGHHNKDDSGYEHSRPPGPMHFKQIGAMEYTRKTWGGKTEAVLEAEGVGRVVPAKSKGQIVDALSANVYVGEQVTSKDIYMNAMSKLQEHTPKHSLGPQLTAFTSVVHARSATTKGRKTPKEKQQATEAPPLRYERSATFSGRPTRIRAQPVEDTVASLTGIKARLQQLQTHAPGPPAPMPSYQSEDSGADARTRSYATSLQYARTVSGDSVGAATATASLGFEGVDSSASGGRSGGRRGMGEVSGRVVYHHSNPLENPGKDDADPQEAAGPQPSAGSFKQAARSYLKGLESSKKLLVLDTMTAQKKGKQEQLLAAAFGGSSAALTRGVSSSGKSLARGAGSAVSKSVRIVEPEGG